MKKKILILVSVIVLIIILIPILTGNLEKETLNQQTRARLEGSFIELSNGYTHYELKGPEDGKTIILVHGNAAPSFTWDNNIDALADAGFRVLRYDVYGHGYSDRPKLRKYDRELYDEQLVELKEKLNITEPVYMIGTSQGGCITTYFAASHPEEVEKVALLSPLFDTFPGKNRVNLLKTRFIGEYMMNVSGDKMLTDPSKVLYSDEKKQELTDKLKKQINFKGKKRAVLANMRGNAIDDATIYYEKLGEEEIPIMLTWGENDKKNTKESMEKLQQLIPKIQYHEIEKASHLAHYEFPDVINKLLIDYLNQ